MNEGTSATGYVENPMRSDTSKAARKNRAAIREISSSLGLSVPDSAQKRTARDQLSKHARAVAMANCEQPATQAFVEKSSDNDEGQCESAKRVFVPDDPEI